MTSTSWKDDGAKPLVQVVIIRPDAASRILHDGEIGWGPVPAINGHELDWAIWEHERRQF